MDSLKGIEPASSAAEIYTSTPSAWGMLLPWHSLTTADWWLHEWLQVQLLSCLVTKPLLCSSFSSPLYGTRRRWSPPISFLILTAFVQTFRLSPPPAHQCQAKLNIDCCTDKKGFDQSDPKIRMNPTSEPMTGTITNHIRISCPMRKVFTSFALANIYFPAQKKCSCLPFVSASPLKM